MKLLKDLDDTVDLSNIIVKTSCGKIGYWKSQWHKGVWLKGHSDRIHPVFVESLNETLEWKVIEDEKLINLE